MSRYAVKTLLIALFCYAVMFMVIALLATALGSIAMAGLAAEIANVLGVVFLALLSLSIIARRRPQV